jgi:hypothetical protein
MLLHLAAVTDPGGMVMGARARLLLFAIGCLLPGSATAQDDTLAVEALAIRDLLGAHPHGGVIALDVRFAAAGQAPPGMTGMQRPLARQRALEIAIALLGDSATTDTVHVQASAPLLQGDTATISVTVSWRGSPERRRSFYETVAYVLRRQPGRWVVHRKSQLGIS